jgi:anaphase-promoting complex subunit 4
MARSSQPLELELFSTSKLGAPASGGHLACNPVIDLTATVGDAGSVLYVWRASDQLVSKHTERGQRAEALRWKEDGKFFLFLFLFLDSPFAHHSIGQFLAAGWSDGVVRLIGLESSKAVHHIRLCEAKAAPVKINFIAWSRNVTRRQARRPVAPRTSPSTLDSQDIRLDERERLLDLPHELTFLEVETALPKISPLPVSGGSG